MVERRKLETPPKRPGVFSGRTSKVDRRKLNGRPKGVSNKIPKTLKEAILGAMEIMGDKNKGQKGLIGFFVKVFQKDITLAVRLAEKILPMQVAGHVTTNTLHIPPEIMQSMTVEQLTVLDSVLRMLAGQPVQGQKRGPVGDADAYAREIGLIEHQPVGRRPMRTVN